MHQSNQGQPISLVIMTALLIWAALEFGPVLDDGEIRILPAIAAALAAMGCINLLIALLSMAVRVIDYASAHSASGKEGTAMWERFREIKKELLPHDEGPFWGVARDKNRKGLFMDFSSNAFVVGPSGSGKGHTSVVPMILSIMHSKIITDFKPELLCICKSALEEMGQIVIALNPFGKYSERTGKSDSLNPLDIVVDDLYREGGLLDVLEDDREMNLQLYPEPPDSKGDDRYWRDGARDLLSLTKLIECMMNGYDATLAAISRQIENRIGLSETLCMVAGIEADGKPSESGPFPFESADWAQIHDAEDLSEFLGTIRSRAEDALALMRDDPKMFSSFAKGAALALSPYSFGRLSSAMKRTSFDFDAIKSGDVPLNIFIVGDASRSEATEKFFGLMQWTMQLKLKRHPHKAVPVYQINDEASNYAVHGLISLMTWGRGFGIRTIQFFQNFSSYEAKHGKKAVDVLISESEIQLYLPGQRSPETIKRIVEILGRQSVMAARFSQNVSSGLREDMGESARPLATHDEVRRSEYGYLIVRQYLPILQMPVSYSQISPWRSMADINPHHGKPFLQKIKLRLKRYRG